MVSSEDTATGGALCSIPFMIADTVILSLFWNDPCDQPLKWWLLSRLIASVVLAFYYSIVPKYDRNRCISFIVWAGQVFLVVFLHIYFYSSDTCDTTNPHLYKLVFAYLIMFYIGSGLSVIVVTVYCFVACCCGKNMVDKHEIVGLTSV